MSEHSLQFVIDLDPDEREEIESVISKAKAEGSYLHIEVRRNSNG